MFRLTFYIVHKRFHEDEVQSFDSTKKTNKNGFYGLGHQP